MIGPQGGESASLSRAAQPQGLAQWISGEPTSENPEERSVGSLERVERWGPQTLPAGSTLLKAALVPDVVIFSGSFRSPNSELKLGISFLISHPFCSSYWDLFSCFKSRRLLCLGNGSGSVADSGSWVCFISLVWSHVLVACLESPFLLKVLPLLTACLQSLSVPSFLPSHSRRPGGTSPFLFVEPPAADLLT